MTLAKGISTAMASSCRLTKFGANYVIKCLILSFYRHATITRPGITYFVNKVCHFLVWYLEEHCTEVKRILRMAADSDDKMSLSGACICVDPYLVTWCSKYQNTISHSSAEAENMNLALAAQELPWVQSPLIKLQFSFIPPAILCNNLSTVALAHNPVLHSCTKHIELDLLFVRKRSIARLGWKSMKHVWRFLPSLSSSFVTSFPYNSAGLARTEEKIEEKENKGLKLKETFYISHGSPTLVIDETIPAWKFLKSWKEVFPHRPSSILIISGHWDTNVSTVNTVDQNDTIYDFYGFPRAMYKLKYPAPGAPNLAKRVRELLIASGFSRLDEDTKRGLDHGAWVPLMLMYPEADIPVCQLSLSSKRGATYHYNMGKALAPLKDEGVLIIGSGSATHNLRAIAPRTTPPAPWALAFMSWLKNSLLDGRYEEVNQYEEKAPYAKVAHPSPDHFFPLHVAMGAAGENAKTQVVHDSWDSGSFSYASFGFTAATSS